MSYLPALPGPRIKTYAHVEVLRLKVGDIRRQGLNYSLAITRSKKRKAEVKLLPITLELGQALDDYILSADLKPSAPLFPGHENDYRYQIRRCAERGGLPNWKEIVTHSFRHGRVYDLASKNTHPG